MACTRFFLRAYFLNVVPLLIIPLLLGGCSGFLAEAAGAAAEAQVKVNRYWLDDLDRLIGKDAKCYEIQMDLVEDLVDKEKSEEALALLRGMHEAPLPFQFLKGLKNEDESVFLDPRWCGEDVETPAEELEVDSPVPIV